MTVIRSKNKIDKYYRKDGLLANSIANTNKDMFPEALVTITEQEEEFDL